MAANELVFDFKTEAHRLIDQLPATATWDDVQYAIYIRIAIEQGLVEVNAGRKTDDETFRRRYGLRA